MTNNNRNPKPTQSIDLPRRKLLGAAGAGLVAAAYGGIWPGAAARADGGTRKPLRWGIVGTGGIAHSMAPRIQQAVRAQLAAVSSRKMETARRFADQFGIGNTYDSWAEMIASDTVDAVYVATPTSVREEICLAAANGGRHVLGEKPFANLGSLQRITAACRDNRVGFMDGTHFVHHPRTARIKSSMNERVGWPWSVASAFQFGLADTTNIRMNPHLEPYGAIGDAGWYNMRAAAEFLPIDLEVAAVNAHLRRSNETGAVISSSGVIVFRDGSTTTYNCGFDSGAGIMDLRISGTTGAFKLNDFVVQRSADNAGIYEYLWDWANAERIEVPAEKPAATLMFEDFAAMVGDPKRFEASVQASERTQMLLDAVWDSAVANEA